MSRFQNLDLPSLLITASAALIAIMGHEVSHGLMAYFLGDRTAKDMGRLNFNPIRHVDPFGLLSLIVFGFGWAKPVPVDMRYFRKPKRDMALTALAGPVSNFLMAYIAMLLFHPAVWLTDGTNEIVNNFFATLWSINIGLGVFNLFPIPPLDGSKILGSFLPDRIYFPILRLERYGMLILMAVLWLGWLDEPLYFLRSGIRDILAFCAFW